MEVEEKHYALVHSLEQAAEAYNVGHNKPKEEEKTFH